MDDRLKKVIWAAGFVDGEGSIFISSQKQKNSDTVRQYVGCLSVCQSNPYPLYIFRELWSGIVKKKRQGPNSFSAGSAIYEWLMCGRSALYVLEELQPYLVVKFSQAELIIDFCKGLVNREYDKEDQLNLHELSWQGNHMKGGLDSWQ